MGRHGKVRPESISSPLRTHFVQEVGAWKVFSVFAPAFRDFQFSYQRHATYVLPLLDHYPSRDTRSKPDLYTVHLEVMGGADIAGYYKHPYHASYPGRSLYIKYIKSGAKAFLRLYDWPTQELDDVLQFFGVAVLAWWKEALTLDIDGDCNLWMGVSYGQPEEYLEYP